MKRSIALLTLAALFFQGCEPDSDVGVGVEDPLGSTEVGTDGVKRTFRTPGPVYVYQTTTIKPKKDRSTDTSTTSPGRQRTLRHRVVQRQPASTSVQQARQPAAVRPSPRPQVDAPSGPSQSELREIQAQRRALERERLALAMERERRERQREEALEWRQRQEALAIEAERRRLQAEQRALARELEGLGSSSSSGAATARSRRALDSFEARHRR